MNDTEKKQELQQNIINFDNVPSIDKDMSLVPAELLTGFNNVDEFLRAFTQYLNMSKKINSENTKNAYKSNVKQFLVWMNKCKIAVKNIVSTKMLRNLVIYYEEALKHTDFSQNTKALKHASIRKFFEMYSFMHEEYNIDLRKCFSADWCTTADSNAYKKQTRINADVFNAIKGQADLGDINDKWIFFLLAFGCRRSEIATVKVKDIDFLNKEINIFLIKTKDVKKIPTPNWLTSDDVLMKDHNFLIYNNSKKCAKSKGVKKVSEQFIYDKIQKWISKTEFKNVSITPHSFRRYFVTSLLKQGASTSSIATLGAWRSLNVVQKYGYDISLGNNPIIEKNMVKY